MYAELKNLPESTSLDFKRCWHNNNIRLLHDILCLANSRTRQPQARYLVFGIANMNREILGVAGDNFRKNTAQIYDMLKQRGLNQIPEIEVATETINGHELDILRIEDRPFKPYYLLRDAKEEKETLRAGVKYTRNGDTNTPWNGTASDSEIDWMFKERFGLEMNAKDRIISYMRQKEGWRSRSDRHGRQIIYFERHPEIKFTVTHEEDDGSRIIVPWAYEFPDRFGLSRDIYTMSYQNTDLEEIVVFSCDGGRVLIAQPNIWLGENVESHFYIEGSLPHLFQEILNKTEQQDWRTYDVVHPVFPDLKTARSTLKEDWENDRRYAYYQISPRGVDRVYKTHEENIMNNIWDKSSS